MELAIFIVLGFIALLIVSAVYVFVVACYRFREPDWLNKEEVNKTPHHIYYENILSADKWLNDHNMQPHFMVSRDGLKLYARWIPAKDAKGTVLFAHGYRSTVLVDFGLIYEYYHSLGFNLLIPDQRCHGKSEGKWITFGVKESDDMLDWIAYHNQHFGAYPMVLSGLSMGASTMLYTADRDLPENVRAIIADCGFTSPKEIISSVYKRVIRLPGISTLFLVGLLTKWFAGFRLDEKDSRTTLANSRVPVLIVHGTEDDFVPCEMSRQAYAACNGPKELLLVEGAGHGTSFLIDKEKYVRTVNQLFRENISQKMNFREDI